MTDSPQLHRHLRLFDATMLVVGSMIGSGIFFGLSIMAQWVETPGLLIGLWVFGGLFTMLGAISCAELAAMYPHAGGQYVFLREAYGEFWAFLFGWTQFLVIQNGLQCRRGDCLCQVPRGAGAEPGRGNVLLARIPLGELLPLAAQAASAPLLAVYAAQFGPTGGLRRHCRLLTVVNIRGVREGAFVQNLFTVLKVVALVALIVAGLGRSGGSSHSSPWSSPKAGRQALQTGFLAGLAVALQRPYSPTTPGTRSRSWPRRSTIPIERFPRPCCLAACW